MAFSRKVWPSQKRSQLVRELAMGPLEALLLAGANMGDGDVKQVWQLGKARGFKWELVQKLIRRNGIG